MHFVINYEFTPDTHNEAQARFKAGGVLPPDDGVKMLARWHYADGHGGFLIAESADPLSLLPNGCRSGPPAARTRDTLMPPVLFA